MGGAARTGSSKTQSEPRSRTFTGCATCRSRHLKCDEARPSCNTCRRLGLQCQGYAPRLLWITEHPFGQDDKQKHRASSYRYPLFTEGARSSMSVEIIQSLKSQSAEDVLLDLDSGTIPEDESLSVGPFGVFRAFEEPSAAEALPITEPQDSPSSSSPPSSPIIPVPVCGASVEDDIEEVPQQHWSESVNPFPGDEFLSQALQASFAGETIDPDSWMGLGTQPSLAPISLDGFSMNLFFSPPRSPRETEVTQIPSRAVSPPRAISKRNSSRNAQACVTEEAPAQTIPQRIPSPPDSTLSTDGSTLPAHAATLLRYLKGEVLDNPSSELSSRMSPWKLLLLPCALETFAEISLWNTASHTRRSILCTLIAKSAFYLHKSIVDDDRASDFWLNVGESHQHSAQEHLKAALRTEFDGEGEAKYTHLLMAVLGVGVVSVHFQGPRAVRKLLLDAERLIRLRGLPAKKSFSLRVLHHMYTYLRVLAESTNVFQIPPGPDDSSSFSTTNTQSQESTALIRNFRVTPGNLGQLDIARNKPEDVGYNDIHLEDSGYWPATLYPDIYGIPESLMTLLSQTISLVNEKPRLEAAAAGDITVSVALSHHIKTLEQQIWTWSIQSSRLPAGPLRPESLVSQDTPPLDRPQADFVILAMHQALLIYFYRRMYNMSAMIVQDQVRKVLDFIQPCLERDKYDTDFAISIVWATFVAVCEAVAPDLKKRGLQCLDAVEGKGVFIGPDKPSLIVKAVWDRRETTGDLAFSWPDLTLQAGLGPLLS